MMYGKTFKATAIKHIMQRAVSPLYMYLLFITGRTRLLLFYRPDLRVMLSNQFFSHKVCTVKPPLSGLPRCGHLLQRALATTFELCIYTM